MILHCTKYVALSKAMIVMGLRGYDGSLLINTTAREATTVKPPNKGHIGDGPFVPCRAVVLFSEVFF